MLSDRYRDAWLMRHWSNDNTGACELCSHVRGDLEHYLVYCSSLHAKRQEIFNWWIKSLDLNSLGESVFRQKILSDGPSFTKFVLDASSDPDIISLIQNNETSLDSVFHLTHTYCYSIHRARIKLITIS